MPVHPRELVAAVIAAGVVGWSALTGCSYPTGGGTSSTGGCYAGATPVTCNIVKFTYAADGPYTVSVDGQFAQQSFAPTGFTYSTSIAVGTHEITGTTWANTLTITLSSVKSNTGGVVQSGGVANVSGPGTASACAVTYTIPTGGTLPQTFHARFTVVAANTGC